MTVIIDDYHIEDHMPETHGLIKEISRSPNLSGRKIFRPWLRGETYGARHKKEKETGACRVFLYTNSKLASALSLYKSRGFNEVDRGESKYPSADMEFELII